MTPQVPASHCLELPGNYLSWLWHKNLQWTHLSLPVEENNKWFYCTLFSLCKRKLLHNIVSVTCIYMYMYKTCIIFNLHSVVWQRLSHHISFFCVTVFCYCGSVGLAFLGFDDFRQFVCYLTSHHSIVFNEADIFQSLGCKWFTNNITYVNTIYVSILNSSEGYWLEGMPLLWLH